MCARLGMLTLKKLPELVHWFSTPDLKYTCFCISVVPRNRCILHVTLQSIQPASASASCYFLAPKTFSLCGHRAQCSPFGSTGTAAEEMPAEVVCQTVIGPATPQTEAAESFLQDFEYWGGTHTPQQREYLWEWDDSYIGCSDMNRMNEIVMIFVQYKTMKLMLNAVDCVLLLCITSDSSQRALYDHIISIIFH